MGTFTPFGLIFSGTNSMAQCILNEILKFLRPINASRLKLNPDLNSAYWSDIQFLQQKGVPGGSLDNAMEKYFYFHHSNGDTMTVEDSHTLDLCTAVWAVTSYAIASLDKLLPR